MTIAEIQDSKMLLHAKLEQCWQGARAGLDRRLKLAHLFSPPPNRTTEQHFDIMEARKRFIAIAVQRFSISEQQLSAALDIQIIHLTPKHVKWIKKATHTKTHKYQQLEQLIQVL